VDCGLVLGETVLELGAATGGRLGPPLEGLLSAPEAMDTLRELDERAREEEDLLQRCGRPLENVGLMAPVPRPGKVLCLGLNYRDHAAESGADVPEEPVVFSKASSSVIGTGEPIRIPEASNKIDYEVELAFVIGRTGRQVSAPRAMDYVGGYTVLNDVSARDYQMEKGGSQWTLAKSFDTFCPLGPWLVTPDEVGDPEDLRIECRVSGDLMQSSSTDQMIFGVAEVIEYLSRVLTLEPGDVVATGTPPGVGFVRTPPRFLRDGDVVECSVERIGTLTNPVESDV
jgi:2-keto-4-pentenoate hydratase/2-oxohepta-3-ene-1,7-dioic acid hydratase in catechol pathway